MEQAPFPILRTARLTLRPPLPEDRAEFVRVHKLSRPLHEPFSPLLTVSIEERFEMEIMRSQAELRDGTGARFVAMKGDNRPAAYVNLSQIFRLMFQNTVMGWRANAEVAGQGYCTEAVKAVLDYAFAAAPDGLNLHRVQAAIIPRNAASLRVAEKCGFRREGLALRYLQIAGQWEDHILFAKLADEHRPTT
jgi:ribosomal-protein-alanine N-acetyltransferase